MLHKNFEVKGKVQGVWFRKYTLDKARSLGLTGFVENRKDGSVYLEAECSASALSEMRQWLREGSPQSRVEEVLVQDGGLKGFSDFQIRR